jgi:DNA-binding beta-propeller fold protein YncE
LAVFGLAVWLAVMPVAEFAVTHPQTFWQRTQNVSILRNREDPDLGRALLHSIQKHLLMFNDHGDNNGRHNLPGAPELDQLSAVLFVLGLALALTRRDPAGRFFLWLLPVGLAGGILSLDFEAPQSLRTIAAMPAVVYFVALSLDALWLEMVWAVGIIRPRFSLVPVMLGLGVIAVGNGTTYFVRQAQDTAVWEAFSTAETLVGKQVAAQGADPIYYFSPFLYDHPSIRFHAPAVSPQSVRKVMPLPDPLPARETAGRPVVYFIHPDDVWVFDLARQMYPSAHFETLPHDPDRPPVVYMVRLEPADVASLQGLTVSYWTGEDDTQAPVVTAHSPQVDVDWPGAAPTRLPFVAGWDGVLWVPEYGPYTLAVRAPDQVSLTLDGATSQSSGQLTLTQLLAQGNHYLRLRARGAPGRVQLAWQPPGNEMAPIPAWALYHSPVGAHGLLGKYYASPDWQGSPVMERVDPLLNTYFHLTPLPRPYSVEWSGSLQVPSDGVYSLGLRAVDRAQLYLDGQLTVDAAAPDQYVERMVTLEAGLHEVRVTFQDLTGRSRIHLYWTPPGGEKEILPSVVLWPSQASAKAAPPPATQPPQPVELPVMGLAYRASWGAAGQGDGQFLEPRAVAVISDTVYVADTGNRRVQAWGSDGTFHGAWDGGEEPFEEPLALGVDHQGRLLVLDSLPGWIYRFNAAGEAFDRIAGPTTQTYHPRGMRVLPDDTIAVADTGGGRLVFFDPAGDKVGELGRPGNAPGQLSEPTDVVVDQTGIFYVLEAYSHRLQLLDSSGGSLGSWSIPESVALDGPHMTWAPDGSLLVTAPAQGAILRYAPDGRLLNRWTDAGPLPMQQPVGIYLDDATHTLYVTDTASDQVYVFRLSYP